MIHQLPPSFEERMQRLLADSYEDFKAAYIKPAFQGLRVNPLKITKEDFLRKNPFTLQPIPWCENGFYYGDEDRPGKHPYHACGLYYLQEPSAMAVAAALDVQPGDTVLDLCAAPGGKSTQIAGMLKGEGLLIANEIHSTRAKALSENIERLGITNAIVTNETPEKLAARLPLFFDHILVDAPCSGEGMFRKLPEAIEDWSEAKVLECFSMQKDILDAAAAMLKPGGTLVYSTCTFAPLENEGTVSQFLDKHPEFELLLVPHAEYFAPGRADWVDASRDLSVTSRLWPHLLDGEGHYIAKFRKKEDADAESAEGKSKKSKSAIPKEAMKIWEAFAKEVCPGVFASLDNSAAFTLFGENLYYTPAPQLSLDGLKVVRAGWHLGVLKKNRFEPAHALALALRDDHVKRTADFSADSSELLRYLRGESISVAAENGWTLVTVDGYSLGWGKLVDNQLKNHYPKGLRWM